MIPLPSSDTQTRNKNFYVSAAIEIATGLIPTNEHASPPLASDLVTQSQIIRNAGLIAGTTLSQILTAAASLNLNVPGHTQSVDANTGKVLDLLAWNAGGKLRAWALVYQPGLIDPTAEPEGDARSWGWWY